MNENTTTLLLLKESFTEGLLPKTGEELYKELPVIQDSLDNIGLRICENYKSVNQQKAEKAIGYLLTGLEDANENPENELDQKRQKFWERMQEVVDDPQQGFEYVEKIVAGYMEQGLGRDAAYAAVKMMILKNLIADPVLLKKELGYEDQKIEQLIREILESEITSDDQLIEILGTDQPVLELILKQKKDRERFIFYIDARYRYEKFGFMLVS